MPKVAADSAAFAGFPEAGFKFLKQLKQHNDREWFRERKADYQELVEEPMKALVLAVAAKCRASGLELHAKERSPVMRVYRDVRFSKNKEPFKTHVGADLRRSFTDSQGLLYVHISPEESFAACGVYQPERTLLQAWRERIATDSAQFEKVEKTLAKNKLKLNYDHSLTKLPRGFQQHGEEPWASALKLTSFVVSNPLAAKRCASPALVDDVVAFALAARPLLEFAWEVETVHARAQRKKLREEELV